MVFKAGEITQSDLAPNWNDMTKAQQAKWKAFALDLTGRTEDEDAQ
ncbi:Uncharacterized protein AC507_1629 [Pseudomonas syringae pv. maculicola]|nr:Uncharacterized protein AC507_1629 [Pseudomonas syringae pv. maculicola]